MILPRWTKTETPPIEICGAVQGSSRRHVKLLAKDTEDVDWHEILCCHARHVIRVKIIG